ncbi:MAG: right-handed parallel beta-helix repeat-containing protein [Clostridia bacterium]|nr:right-handed parallel beta-helix repeat-containing protein [Clostridia bacterium]
MDVAIRKTTVSLDKVETLYDALESVKAIAREATPESPVSVELVLDYYRYTLDKPVVFSAEEEPALANIKLSIVNKEGMRPCVTSLRRLDLSRFEAVEGKPYYKYQFDKDENGAYPLFHDFYAGGGRVPMARSEIMIHPFKLPPKEEREKPENLRGIYLPYEEVEKLAKAGGLGTECQIYVEWTWSIMRIVGVDLSSVKEHEGKKYALVELEPSDAVMLIQRTHPELNINNRRCFFSNNPAYLTTPNSYTYDYRNGVLYYYPPEGKRACDVVCEYPTLENLFIFEGLNNVTLEGITFYGATSKYVCENGYFSGQANCEKNMGRVAHAAVCTSNMRNFTVKACRFIDLGANGLQMRNRSVGVRITDCVFKGIGMSAVSIGNPSLSWKEKKDQNFNILIENNYFEHIAYEYPTAAAIYFGKVDTLHFCHNTVKDTAYSAVSGGWGWSPGPYALGEAVNIRDAELAYNLFEDYMMVLQDGGAIYMVGANCNHDNDVRFNCMHDNYATCKEMRPSGRYGYYMDGATTNWECYHSVVLNTNMPIFSQPHPYAASFHNHIRDVYSNVNGPLEWIAPSRDVTVEDYHVTVETEAELLARCEEARAIREAAGCRLIL